MSYHESTKELAMAIAVLEKAKFHVEQDRYRYRSHETYQKALRLLGHAIAYLKDQWNRLKDIWNQLVGEVREETPKAVRDRIRKSRDKHLKARMKWGLP